MNKKSWLLIALVLVTVAVVGFSCAGEEATGPQEGEENLYFEWTAAYAGARTEVPGFPLTGNEWFFDQMEQRTDGRFKVEIVYGGVLGKQTENPYLCASGAFEIGQICQAYHPDDMPLNGIPWMPFWSPAEPELIPTMIDYGFDHPLAQEEMAMLNLICPLHHIAEPLYQLTVRKGAPEIKSTADFKGLQMRAYGSWGTVWTSLGAVPVFMAFNEQYEGLQKGMLDVSLGGIVEIQLQNLYEVADRVIEGALCPTGGAWAVNLDDWNNLPQYIKDLWFEVRPEFNEYRVREAHARLQPAYDTAAENGIRIYELEDYSNLEAAGNQSWVDFVEKAEQSPSGKEVRQYLRDLIDYRNDLTGKDWVVYSP